jgi:asparagine synthase (glutamine-hydrolysing)
VIDALEVAVGQVLGRADGVPPLEHVARGRSRQVLDGVVLEALCRAPCAVSFSGGRDSSALLALAAHIARREGLDPPVALTLVFPEVPSTDELDWQEHVLRHVGITEWEKIEIRDELDYIGPYARRCIARHGLLFPPNAYVHLPMVDRVPGGSLITGAGGDEVVGTCADHLTRAIALRTRPARADLRALIDRLSPSYARRLGEAHFDDLPWVRPEARLAAADREGPMVAWFGMSMDRGLRRWASSRYCNELRRSLRLIGLDADVDVVSPFLEERFIAAFARDAGFAGFGSRSLALKDLVGDLVTQALRERTSKAEFGAAFFQSDSRALVDGWTGDGIDPELVDIDALDMLWRSGRLDGRTSLLLQSLAIRQGLGSERGEHVEHVGKAVEPSGTSETEGR